MNQKISGLILFVVAVGAFFYFIHSTSRQATSIFIHGRIYTLDASNTVAEAVAIRAERIVGTGTTKEILDHYRSDVILDLEGKTMMPGFIDAHAHMDGLGQYLQSIILAGVPSAEEAVEMVRNQIPQKQPGDWIYGRGWDQNLWQVKEFPSASLLDNVAPENPVVLVRIDGHACWVNSRAMAIANISKETKDTTGGKIIRDAKGNPTGVFLDNARDLVENYVPPLTRKDIQRNVVRAAQECVKLGLTEIGDMGLDSTNISAYKELADEQKLPLRIYGAISAPGVTWESWSRQQPMVGYGNGMLTIRAMKLYADGALGSRGAALVEEYSDDPGNRGITLISDEELEKNILLALQQGFQPLVHAIGDRGNHIALNAFEKALSKVPKGDYRPRIEHAQVILSEDIPRFKQLGVYPSMQPIHATSDMYWAEARLGPLRVRGAYAWKSLLNTGTMIFGGSDFPNDGMNPLWGFYAAVTRSDRNGYPQEGWYREQKMTREEAARCFTQWAAYGAFEEKMKGTIEVGKWADLTILSKDIMEIPPTEILSTEVVMTIVGGKIVYQKPVATTVQ